MSLNDGHWLFKNYSQRMTTKEWKEILLNEQDKIIVNGNPVRLKAKSLGCGVVEVSKGQKGWQ